jgi:hypothetical protein
MKEINDKELHELMKKWDVPEIPPSLTENLLQQYRSRLKWNWHWLITGSLRVPVPVAALAMLIIFGLAIVAIKQMTLTPPLLQTQVVNRVIEIPVIQDSTITDTVYSQFSTPDAIPGHFDLREFQPIKSLAPRIVRSE